MKTRVTILAAMLFAAGVVASCEEKLADVSPKLEPIDVLFTEFLLGDCQWKNYDSDGDTLIIINYTGGFGKHVACPGDSDDDTYPTDDLQYTLLLASGTARNSPVVNITKQLTKTAENEYNFSIDITTGNQRAISPWLVAIAVPKLSNDATISLNVNEHY